MSPKIESSSSSRPATTGAKPIPKNKAAEAAASKIPPPAKYNFATDMYESDVAYSQQKWKELGEATAGLAGSGDRFAAVCDACADFVSHLFGKSP